MNKIIKKIADYIYKSYSKAITNSIVNRFLFAFSFFLLFVLYKNNIETFIETFILVKPNFSNVYIDIILFSTTIVVSILIVTKIIQDEYIPSYSEIFVSFLILFFIIYYGTNNKWNVLKCNILNFEIKYLILIGIPILLFLSFCFYNWHKKKYNNPENSFRTNHFISDDPILDIDQDILDSKKVANNLIQILKNENHENSFTLGLVGPWGNGKSSVINFVKDDLNKNKENNTISIQFLPYLNHNENDIINEFFILLSNQLGKYSGKVSNQLMLYSKKITNLYKDKNIVDFLEDQITKIESTSANQLYNEINEHLKEINKKIIVFIDDLDRLNEKEILQVLKLIRNTANFKNTFFVVAMDKEYVLSRLKSSNDILNTAFIDKFFQLEIYLPEIDNSILRNFFFDCLNNSILQTSDGSFKNELIEAMSNEDNLFNDFIKNMRDVKRVANQIVYDYPIFKNEIDLKDFMNFTYFKLKFPKYLKLLNDRKADFIYIDREKETYNLIKKTTKENPDDILDELNKVKLYNIDFLYKYKSFPTKECKDSELSINCEDKILLLKILAYLFGEENNVPDSSSIKNENNFRMLVQQQIFPNYFSQREFNILYDNDIDLTLLTSIFLDNKLPQLIKRLKDLNTNSELKIKRSIQIITLLYDQRRIYNLYDVELLSLLNSFINRQFENDIKNTENLIKPSVFSKWLMENIFNNEKLSKETRLYLLGHLWYSRRENKSWHISPSNITVITKRLFKSFINEFSDEDVNNFEIYFIYNSIKEITNIKSHLNKLIIDYWESNLELTCAQSIEFQNFSNSSFKISDTISEIIESKIEFINFIKSHKQNELPEIKEFLLLFDLLLIKNFADFAIFEFQKSKKMKDRINYVKNIPTRSKRDINENIREVFFESNSEELVDYFISNQPENSKVTMTKFIYLNKFYLVIKLDRKGETKSIISFINSIVKNQVFHEIYKIPSTINPENKYQIYFEIKDGSYFKSFSIQPKL
ncbi:KAP family P-loop NTPase fold protein [Flavobacterium sp. UBA4854]|uniref:KAP family P-loop NTPase fold protein n=1 Tax=Flavobacterium sp. UBA4854 TaxID=1946548 RepID=UPI00257C8DAF|nr:P-loop NTPase fold protein [Flavobacterium sp. UBA4854]